MSSIRAYRFSLALYFVILIVLVLIYFPVIDEFKKAVYVDRRMLLIRKSLLLANHTGHISSTCNEGADLRGPHQKVIAYSVYGNLTQPDVNRRYLKPLVKTAKTILRVYPGIFQHFQNLLRGKLIFLKNFY